MSQPVTNQPDYTPQEHLIVLKTPDGPKEYYPFNWRLHEFRLRYPGGVLDAQIIQVDLERDFVIVKATASEDGLDNCKGVGLQTGSLVLLHQVTNHAKVQALADLGIGCPWPVIFEDELDDAKIVKQAVEASSNGHTPNHLESARRLFASTFNVQPEALVERWAAYKVNILGAPVDDSDLTPAQLARVHGSIVAKEKELAQHSGQQHKPARTASTVQAFFAKQYQVKPVDLDTRWAKFKAHVLKTEITDDDLTEEQLSQLNAFISQQYQKQQAQRPVVRKVS